MPAAPSTWAPTPPDAQRAASRWPSFAALVIAAIALAIAIAGWLRPPTSPPPEAPPTYTEQQVADAKAKACEAFDLVDRGVVLQTSGGENLGTNREDPTLIKAQAANARLSLVAGSTYLREHVSPAAPANLAAEINHLADVLADLGARYLAGEKDSDPTLATLLGDGEDGFQQIEQDCK